MKKQLLAMISILCLMASSAFAAPGSGHFEDITQVGPSIPPDFPTCAAGTVLTYNGHVFSCSSNLTINGCPAGQALNSESGAGGLTSYTCENLSCPPGQALEYPNDGVMLANGTNPAVPTCMPAVSSCPAGQVLTYDGTKYSCTVNVWLNLSCPAGQAIQSIAGGNAVCAIISCPIGSSLNTPSAGGPPSCIIPPSCAAGQVLTYNVPAGSGYSCTSKIETIACPANEALVSIAANGQPTCKKLPQFGGCPAGYAVNGVYTGGVVPTCVAVPGGSCPTGETMQVVGLTPTCVPTAGSGPCPNGEVVTQLNGAGTPPSCATAGEPGICGLPNQGIKTVHPVGNGAPTCTPLASQAGCGGGTYVNGVHGANPPDCGPITISYTQCIPYFQHFGGSLAACSAANGGPKCCDPNSCGTGTNEAGAPCINTWFGTMGGCAPPFVGPVAVTCTPDGPTLVVCYDPAGWTPGTSCPYVDPNPGFPGCVGSGCSIFAW